MIQYKLSFGVLFHHDNGVLETLIDNGIELTEEMVNEFFNVIRSIEPKVELCLVNRKNAYSYTFKANMMLASSDLVKYVAVLKHGRLPWPLKGIFSPKLYRLGFFDDYDEAMSWLLEKNNKSFLISDENNSI